MFIKILEFARIGGVCLSFFIGYMIGFKGTTYDAVAQLHVMIPLVIVAIAGTSGIEGIFFGDQAAKAKGYEVGSNYQLQSAIALLSYACISLLILVLDWGIKAELAVLFTFMFFFFFSAANHLRNAVIHKNYRFANLNRPFLVLALIAGLIYPVVVALGTL
ncbi:MAG: DUF6790 family protein [Anaerolineae bacterium]